MTAHASMNDSEPDWSALQHAGVQKFRMQISWQTINVAGGGGEFGWKNESGWVNTYDRYFEKAAKHGIAILPYIYTRKSGSTQYYWPGEPAFPEWKEFVWTVVQRYGQAGSFWVKHPNIPQLTVEYWEVWNEPNLPMNCPAESCNGKEYGEFLVATATTIREAQSKISGYPAKVLSGGLYQERWNYPVASYIAALGKAPGIGAAYDGLSLHPYALGKQSEGARTTAEKAGAVQSNIYEAYSAQSTAIGAKPIWVTEVGWPVDGTEMQHVTPADQAVLLTETYNWIKNNWSTYNIKFAAWYLYKDVSSDPATRWDLHAGLRTSSGAYRPSWYAYETQTGVPVWPRGQMAFQANTTQLFSYSTGTGPANLGLGMAAGTSPSVATLVNGESAMAFQANTSTLWSRLGSGAYGNTGLGMAAGTSPSVAPLLGGNEEEYVMAFQANTGTLWKRLSSGTYANTELGMAAGTSPSVATLTNGEYVMAFQASTGILWTRSSSGATTNWGYTMKAGTSPSIAALSNGGYEIAFQDKAGNLNSAGTSGHVNWEQGMAAGTSPSITGVPGNGYQMAFQANTGILISTGSLGGINWGQGMATGTSPSITALTGGGYEMAFQANTGELIGIGTAGGTNTGQGMAGGTSPSISPPSRWSS
jgi:hypothetical protein